MKLRLRQTLFSFMTIPWVLHRWTYVVIQMILIFNLAIVSWLGSNIIVDSILNRLILAKIPIMALSLVLLFRFYCYRVRPARTGCSHFLDLFGD